MYGANRARNASSSIFEPEPTGLSIAGMARRDPNAPTPLPAQRDHLPQHDLRVASQRQQAQLGRPDSATAEPARPRIVGGKLVVPGVAEDDSLSYPHSYQPEPQPHFALPSPSGRTPSLGAWEREQQQLARTPPGRYVPGEVSGISNTSYDSAGSRQGQELRGRSSTRLLAPPGGHSSLNWAFGGGGPDLSSHYSPDPSPTPAAAFAAASPQASGQMRLIGGKMMAAAPAPAPMPVPEPTAYGEGARLAAGSTRLLHDMPWGVVAAPPAA